MTTPDDLRNALHDDARGDTAGAEWTQVRSRAHALGRRRWALRGGMAGLAAAAIAAGIVAGTGVLGDDDDRQIVATSRVSSDIVAVQGPNNGGDRLVVLSGDDGRVMRTLTEDIGITFGGISASPDGRDIYFARRRGALPCDRTEIAKVSRDGGPVEVVGPGIHPVVSPDGRTLAFVRPPADDPCGPTRELVRHDLASGTEVAAPCSDSRADDIVRLGCTPLAWSPDGTRLLFALCCDDERLNGVGVLPGAGLGPARFLELTGPADGATYLPDGRILVAADEQDDRGQLHRLVVFDVQPLETLLESREPGVLHITASASGDVLLHYGGDQLQRWTPGAAPVPIAADVRDAAWLPRSRESGTTTTGPTTTTAAPQTEVVAPDRAAVSFDDNRLAVIDAAGEVVRALGTTSVDVHRIALAPDSNAVYFEQGSADLCDDNGEIVRVVDGPEPLNFEFLTNGSFMALSPDGTKLAYRSGACAGDAELVVRDLTTGTEQSFSLAQPNDGGPGAELVGPVGWDADNRHLMVKVNREPSTEFWYVDTEIDDHEVRGPVLGPTGEPAVGPTDFAPLGTTGRWAAVYSAVGGPSLVEYDVAGDAVVRPLGELPDRGVEIAGVDSTGQHVLLLVPSDGGFDLYRWSEGDAVTTLVARGVAAADW